MAEAPRDPRRIMDPNDADFVRRLVLAMALSPLPHSPLAARYMSVLERKVLGRR